MKNPSRLFPCLIACIALVACATTERVSAAGDVHRFLVSIRDDDRQAFDALIDRPALEAQLQSMLVEKAQSATAPDALKGVGLLVSGPLAKAAGKALLRPEVFRAVADYYGYRPDMQIPGALAIAGMLRPVDNGRVCAARGKQGPCLLTFANEDGAWRLVAFSDAAAMLRLGRRGAP
jgi:hypothetical protein